MVAAVVNIGAMRETEVLADPVEVAVVAVAVVEDASSLIDVAVALLNKKFLLEF